MKKYDSEKNLSFADLCCIYKVPGTGDVAMIKTNMVMTLFKKKIVTAQRKLTVFLSSSEALMKPGSVAQVL